MKKFIGYECDYCKKRYRRKSACESHENGKCPNHPNNRHACFGCHYLAKTKGTRYLDSFNGQHEVKSTAFYCTLFKKNLYSYKLDGYDSASMATVDFDSKEPERMPLVCNFEGETEKHLQALALLDSMI